MNSAHQAGRTAGTYVLLLELSRGRRMRVGALGMLDFAAGWYLYVGSAFGPGGLQARCAHHRRVSRRPRWHIDYLRAEAVLREIWFSHDPRRREHVWADLLAAETVPERPILGFGASDCDCTSHLFHRRERPDFQAFQRMARSHPTDQEVIFCELLSSGRF